MAIEESTMMTDIDCHEFAEPSQGQQLHGYAPPSSDTSRPRKEMGKRKVDYGY